MGLFDSVTDFLGLTGGEKSITPPATIGEHYRGGLEDLIRQYQSQAAGTAPSLAELLSRQQRDEANKQIYGIAGAARGASNPFALRSAMQASGSAQQQLGLNEAIGKLQEREAARGALSNIYNADLNRAAGFAGQQMAAAAGEYGVDKAATGKLFGGLMSGFGATKSMGSLGTVAGAMSDENEKENDQDGSQKMYNFLDHLSASSYNYKNPGLPGERSGQFVSPMAQELQKTPVGNSFVQDTPNGKMVDYGHGFGAILAAQASLHERMKAIESEGEEEEE